MSDSMHSFYASYHLSLLFCFILIEFIKPHDNFGPVIVIIYLQFALGHK